MEGRITSWLAALSSAVLLVCGAPSRASAQAAVGIFDGHGDVGTVLHPGSVEYDAAAKSYTITGSGDNIWAAEDDFHYVWKKVSGDVALTANISFIGTGGNEHRKGVLMMRQSLDQDAAYADIAFHGVGLTSLQARAVKGDATHEVQANQTSPKRLRIVKRGQNFYMWLSDGGELQFTGGAMRIALTDPFYVGIGVCSHNKDVSEKAVFSNVELTPLAGAAGKTALYSALETTTVASTDRHVTLATAGRIEAPNWTRDGKSLLFNRDGRLQIVPEAGGKPEMLDTVAATHCNSAHVISPDGSQIAFSDEKDRGRPLIYVMPMAGSAPRRVPREGPAYVAGWSPDGQTLLFTSRRDGKTDIYAIPAAGGKETRLTMGTGGTGLNEAPGYSPDGNYIYFQSDRSGAVQIWRMKPDGSAQEQVTTDDLNNAFPHVSPNGRQMVFLSYPKEMKGYPQDKEVTLRVMTLANKGVTVLARLLGGQGTIDVPSWSPDSRRLAFVSYHVVPVGDGGKLTVGK